MLRPAFALLVLQVVVGACACAGEVEEPPAAPPARSEVVAAELAPVVPLTGELGTSHPVVVAAAAPTGHWVAICQARRDTTGDGDVFVQLGSHGDLHGDEMQTFLIREPGVEEPIDEFVDSDRSGRYVVVVRSGQLVLIDTWDDVTALLDGAEVEDDPNPYGPHRAAAFDDAGTRVGYARRGAAGHEIVVRELETGAEQVIDAGSSLLWRFKLDPTGAFVFAQVVDRDSDGDGVIEPPSAATTLGKRRCRGPVSSFGSYGWKGDEPVLKVAPVRDGASLRSEPGALGALHGQLVVRRADGAIVVREEGSERELMPAACAGRIVYADGARGHVFAVCAAQAGPPLYKNESFGPLWRVAPGEAQDLGLGSSIGEEDVWSADNPLIWTTEGKFINGETGTIGRVISAGARFKAGGDNILYYDTEETYIHELGTDQKRPLPFRLPLAGEGREQGPILALFEAGQTVVVDAAAERLLGRVRGRPYAVTSTGEVLVATRDVEDYLPYGPLRWATPR